MSEDVECCGTIRAVERRGRESATYRATLRVAYRAKPGVNYRDTIVVTYRGTFWVSYRAKPGLTYRAILRASCPGQHIVLNLVLHIVLNLVLYIVTHLVLHIVVHLGYILC